MNNKGLTLIELIISIALISVIIIFMYRLLANVTYEKDNDFIATANSQQRNEIIDSIEKRIFNNANAPVRMTENTAKNKLSFYAANNAIIFTVGISGNKITIANNAGNPINVWTIKGGTIANRITCTSSTSGRSTMYYCKIPVYTTNLNNKVISQNGKTIVNNNTLDDIEFAFILTQPIN